MNAYGGTFERGKSIEKDMRSLIIDDILSEGGDVLTEFHISGNLTRNTCKLSLGT